MDRTKRLILSAIFAVLYVSLFAFIVYQSASSGENSLKESDGVANFLSTLPFFDSLAESGLLSEFTRKFIGHFCEYGLLGVLGFLAVYFGSGGRFFGTLDLTVGFFCCSVGEIVQIFAENRGPEFFDVITDFQGYLTAFYFLIAIQSIIGRKKENEIIKTNFLLSLPFSVFVIVPFCFGLNFSYSRAFCYFFYLTVFILSALSNLAVAFSLRSSKKPL